MNIATPGRPVRFTLQAGTAALILITPAICPAFAAQGPILYEQAQEQLAAHDTIGALTSLRQLTRSDPDFTPGWGLLGRVLSAKASGVATDFRERKEAEEALRHALRREPNNAMYLLSLGLLMRKQQMYLDARRMINRSFDQLKKDPEQLSDTDRAELWYQRGLFLEDGYLDARHLHFMASPPPVSTPDCAGIGSFCENFTRPRAFTAHFDAATDLSEDAEDDYQEMFDAFAKALAADASHRGSFRRQSVHLVDRSDYQEAERLARRFISAAPEEPWGPFVLGLIYQRTGRDSLAEVEFNRGIERASPEIASHYLDVSNLLRESVAEAYSGSLAAQRRKIEEILWRKSDPLYLSSINEVRAGHLARVAYADMMFEDPSEGIWGADTEQGIIYARYGEPMRIWKIRRDPSLEPNLGTQSEARGGGRWIFWNYGLDVPNFIFEKQSRYRHASHVLSSFSKELEEESREALPASFTINFDLSDYPAQIARFRGSSDSIIEVDLYSEVPAAWLKDATPRTDSLDAGFFLFAGVEHLQIFERKLRVQEKPSPQALTYSIALPPGRYPFSLEARAGDGSAAVRRGDLELTGFSADSLSMSDLVLALTVEPRMSNPTGRRDFAIRVNRRFEVEPNDPFALYWEIYGLAVDAESFATYRMVVSVEDAEGKGVLASVIAAVASLIGSGDDDQELVFERTVQVQGDRVADYLSLELADDEPGLYRVLIQVTDLANGESVEVERTFQMTGP